MWEIVAKAAAGGVLVLVFALLAETLSPKRFAGVFAAAPSVALASLAVTVLAKGPADARAACAGMVAGAVGFVVYCAVAPPAMRRFGTRHAAAGALLAWCAVTAAALPLAAATSAGSAAVAVPARVPRRAPIRRPALACDPSKVKQTKPRHWLVRFAFGAGTSALAGVIGSTTAPVVGGAFLAFPAILLASLTLMRNQEGRSACRDDARGATAGALGLVAFALGGAAGFTRLHPAATFGLAALAWAVVGLGTYFAAWATGHGADEPD
ncbi:MAG: DUF3147 family protein [Jatrophihabitans sp.]|uniref:DUF3147 family protein n=1 Tax=Jatrophihabitans sp. TaxID=1932789 RepID=UPI003F81945D